MVKSEDNLDDSLAKMKSVILQQSQFWKNHYTPSYRKNRKNAIERVETLNGR